MARRSQCSSAGDNPLDPNYLPPHYREEYRLAVDALVEDDLDGYYQFLQQENVVDFLCASEVQYIQQSVQNPQDSHHPEHLERFLEAGGDGSSDTYWPVHSDQDAPDLDLGWPHLHHFIGPTEVTTLVNPPESDMPSIKDQARRLVKNAQQVVAVVMDMFTDVDMFRDILDAALRNVPVYILLDEHNAPHFVNMVSNCRVDLQSFPFLRVRTVSGITYQCRSAKSFKGQMMDRFLLTDCRAVLSGNYSFMWSYEKLHRSMAHLFLGQLVSTFDEEFRILYAQSKPLIIENMLLAMEEFNLSQQKQYPSDRAAMYNDPRKFLGAGHPEEWPRLSYDERRDDFRMLAPKKQDPSDMYSRFPSQQPHVDPLFDQGPSRKPMMENVAFRRYGYAEGGPRRLSNPFQQGVPEPESQRRQVPRGQQLYPGPGAGPEADYSGAEKFWSQDYHCVDQYNEPQEMQPPHNFDHVYKYLSTRNVDFEQSSDKLHPVADLPFSSSHPTRPSLGHSYACQTSPPHSNAADQKQFFPEVNVDRKNPMVKRGLRNWRISSYLSAYDNPEEEDLLSAPPQAPEPVEEPAHPIRQVAPATDLSFPTIPNVKEFKVNVIQRASQIPGYAKVTTREQPKKLLEEPAAVVAETKTTPTPSESSSTNEGEKAEEAEQKDQKEPIASAFRREDSFRRKYNPATPRSSRLRSSLIFSSLDQQHSQESKTTPGQQEEESDKKEEEGSKTSFVSKILGQRKSKEPNEWRRYMKTATPDHVASETSKPEDGISGDKEPSKEENIRDPPAQEAVKPADVEQTNIPVPQPKPTKAELPKMSQPAQPLKSLFTTPASVDMSDPDVRLMFFKELAAQRKAALEAEAKKSNEKSAKPSSNAEQCTTVKTMEPGPEETSENMAVSKLAEAEKIKDKGLLIPVGDLTIKPADKIEEPRPNASEKMTKPSSCVSLLDKNATETVAGETASTGASELTSDPTKGFNTTSQSSEAKETGHSNETAKLHQATASLAVAAEVESAQVKPPDEPMQTKAAGKEGSPRHPPTAANGPSLVQGTDPSGSLSPDSTSKDFTSLTPCSAEVLSASASVALDSETQRPESVNSDSVVSSPPLPSEQHTSPEFSSSIPSEVQGSSSDPILPPPSSTISPSLPSSGSDFLTAPPETVLPKVPPEECRSPSTSVTLPLSSDDTEAQGSGGPLQGETPKPDGQSAQTSAQSELTEVPPNPVCGAASCEAPSEVPTVNCEHLECDVRHDTRAAGSEADTSSSVDESGASAPPEKELITSENNADEKAAVADDPQPPGSAEDVKVDTLPPALISTAPLPSLPDVSDNQNESMKPLDQQAVLPSVSSTDMIPDAPQSETAASPQDAPTQVAPPCKPNLPDGDSPPPAEACPCESDASVVSPGSENTKINISDAHSSLDTNSLLDQDAANSDESATLPSEVPTQPDKLCEGPDSKPPLIQPSDLPKLPDPGEKGAEDTEATNKISKVITQDGISSEQVQNPAVPNSCSEPAAETTAEDAVPLSPQSKQPKSGQSRYHSSTANVVSCTNLRDDTKILLEQISANSQSRKEATKDPPVTDDEKEDEADKHAKREKARGVAPGRGQPKSAQERDKVLERIQSMRKERRVYSRFEV